MNRYNKEAVDIAETYSIRIDRVYEASRQIFKYLRTLELTDAERAFLLVDIAGSATGIAMAIGEDYGPRMEKLFEETVLFAIDDTLSSL